MREEDHQSLSEISWLSKTNFEVISWIISFHLWFFSALYPVNQDADTADPDTREFLLAVVKILLDFITDTNDRDQKVVDFHHPIEMRKKLDLAITDKPKPLDSLLQDCKMALENQVKTGEGFALQSSLLARTADGGSFRMQGQFSDVSNRNDLYMYT